MNRIAWLLLIAWICSSCGAPPSRPESLWDSIPPSEEGSAKTVPAKIWSGNPSSESPTEEAPDGADADPEPEVTGTVVLNEVYYDAVGGDTDGLLFVELFGTPHLLIEGMKIHFVDGGDGSIDDSVTLPEGARIPEDGFYVIADAITGNPTGTAVEGADLVDNFDPQNGPDAVQLTDAAGGLIDCLGYGDGVAETAENGLAAFEGAPSVDVVNGHSLERNGPGVDTHDNAVDFIERETPTPGS